MDKDELKNNTNSENDVEIEKNKNDDSDKELSKETYSRRGNRRT